MSTHVTPHRVAPRRIERVAPADSRIGHFALFRDPFQSTLRARVAALLQSLQMNKETP